MRWLAALALLVPSVAVAQLAYAPFITTVDAGGIAGVEQRVVDLEPSAQWVCGETMDESDASISGASYDMAGSPDDWECWGSQRTGTPFFETDGDNQTVDVSAATGWGDANYAYEVTDNSFSWARLPMALVDSSTRRICTRYYMEVSDPFPGAGGAYDNPSGACPNTTWRNKLTQWNFAGGVSQQAQERDSGSCPAEGSNNSIGFFIIDQVGATAEPVTGDDWPVFTPTVRLSDCNNGPCRIEHCISGNLTDGTNITTQLQIWSTETGSTSNGTSRIVNYTSGISDFSVTGGDWWSSGSVSGGKWARRGYFAGAAWTTNSGQLIGAACEIEGGC